MWYKNSDGTLVNMKKVNCIYVGNSGNIIANFGEVDGYEDIVTLEYCQNKVDADYKLAKLSRMVAAVDIGE